MAFLFGDTCDHYATSKITQKWTQIVTVGTGGGAGSGSVTIEAVGRNSSNALRFLAGTSGQSAAFASITLPASGDTVIIQCAFRSLAPFNALTQGTAGAGGTTNVLWNALSGGTVQVWARVNTNGTISILSGTTLLGTSSVALQQDVYAYLEFKIVIHASTGVVVMRINGETVLSLTGQNTQAAGSAAWDEVRIGSLNGPTSGAVSRDWHIDDIMIMDGSGSLYNDMVGDHQGLYGTVNAEGFYTDSTPSSGSDRALMVDEPQANGDTDYNTHAAVDERDSFALNAWPSVGAIGPIQLVSEVRKEDEGAASQALFVRISSTNYDGASQGLNTSYAFKRQVYEQNPNTSAAWQAGTAPEIGYLKSV